MKVPAFLRLLLTSTSLTALNIYIKIQQKNSRDKKDAIIVHKCGGLDVTTTTTTITTTTTAVAAAIQVVFSHCLLKIKH